MGLISPREYLDLVTISRNTETGLHLSYCESYSDVIPLLQLML